MAISYELRQNVKDFLAANPLGVISTVGETGKPWGAAVYFVVDDAFDILFITRSTTAKSQNLSIDPRAAFTVANMSAQREIQAYGTVSQVSPGDEAQQVFDRIGQINTGTDQAPPFVRLAGGPQLVYRLRPSYMRFSDFSTEKQPNDYVNQIIPS
jgi:pyridoxine/pyridoxamine 5'-phosphate oxidase